MPEPSRDGVGFDAADADDGVGGVRVVGQQDVFVGRRREQPDPPTATTSTHAGDRQGGDPPVRSARRVISRTVLARGRAVARR